MYIFIDCTIKTLYCLDSQVEEKFVYPACVLYSTVLLLMSSADNLCKQFGPRSGVTKCHFVGPWSESRLFDTKCYSNGIPEEFFEKKSADKKIVLKLSKLIKVKNNPTYHKSSAFVIY